MRLGMAILAFGIVAADPALAQGMLGRSGAVRPENNREPPRPPIPGLPGLMGRQNVAPIPADVPPASMNPNDALFDGINRGDMATVRDAIARGADVGARNALGLTALDSAVDQARPDIMFYLLSVRGGATNAAPPPDGEAAPPRAARGRREALPREEREPRGRRGAVEAEAAPAPTARQLPVLWAGNGGAPQPELGFLGFDAGRPDGARPQAMPLDDAQPSRRRARRG